MSQDNSLPYIPRHALFNEHIVQPEMYNEYNNRINRLVGDIKEIILDATTMKNIVLGELQKWGEINDKNNFSVHERIDKLFIRIDKIESEQCRQLGEIKSILAEIKDRVTAVEVDDEFDEGES